MKTKHLSLLRVITALFHSLQPSFTIKLHGLELEKDKLKIEDGLNTMLENKMVKRQ